MLYEFQASILNKMPVSSYFLYFSRDCFFSFFPIHLFISKAEFQRDKEETEGELPSTGSQTGAGPGYSQQAGGPRRSVCVLWPSSHVHQQGAQPEVEYLELELGTNGMLASQTVA